MTGVKVTNLSEKEIECICREIGDSFFDHDYGVEKDGTPELGLKKLINDRDVMSRICQLSLIQMQRIS